MEQQLKIGDTFTFRGSTLLVEEVKPADDGSFACEGCYFYEHGLGCYNDYACMDDNREDHTNVIFREVAPATGASHACEGCYFYENEKQCYDVDEMCSDESRADRRNVIFKETGKQTKEEVQ